MQFGGSPKWEQCLLEAPCLVECHAKIVMVGPILRAQRDRLSKLRQPFLLIAGLEQETAEHLVSLICAGLSRDCLAEFLDGLGLAARVR